MTQSFLQGLMYKNILNGVLAWRALLQDSSLFHHAPGGKIKLSWSSHDIPKQMICQCFLLSLDK